MNKIKKNIHFTDNSGKTTDIRCISLLRRVKGCREVYKCEFNNTPAIAKVFLSKVRRRRHLRRERNGLNKLERLGIPTGKILTNGRDSHGNHILILEEIVNAKEVSTVIHDLSISNPAKSLSLLNAVFQCLADMHNKGVFQADLHLGNFLWDGTAVYSLDAAQMKFSSKPLRIKASLSQIAILLATRRALSNDQKLILLNEYSKTRGWQPNSVSIERIDRLIKKHQALSLNIFLKKTLRTCKLFTKIKCEDRTGVFKSKIFQKDRIESFLLNLDSVMENGEILKCGNTCFVSKISYEGIYFVVKRYNHKGFLHSLRHTLKRGRARKCWLFGHRFAALNIPSAKPVAFIEKRKLGLIWQSYIVNEYIDGIELSTIMESGKYTNQEKKSVIRKTETVLDQMINNRMTHLDLKMQNIMISADKPFVIDLDSMKLHQNDFLLNIYKKRMLAKFSSKLTQSEL